MKKIFKYQEFLTEMFSDIKKATKDEIALLKKLVDNYTQDKHLDIEEETALLAICKKLNIEPTFIYSDHLIKNFRKELVPMEEGHVISPRSEDFINKVLCNYIKDDKNHTELEDSNVRELLKKLNLDYDEMKKSCAIKN